jgi:multidrug efflux pump subunit AcrA (membrane-fusion protein)
VLKSLQRAGFSCTYNYCSEGNSDCANYYQPFWGVCKIRQLVCGVKVQTLFGELGGHKKTLPSILLGFILSRPRVSFKPASFGPRSTKRCIIQMNSKTRLNRGLIIFLGYVLPATLLLAGLLFFLWVEKPEPPKVPGLGNDAASLLTAMPAADVYQVKALDDSLDLSASGVVVPYREIFLAAEVAGRIIEKDVSVRPGHSVRAGQTLLKIDPSDYQYEVDRLTQRLEQEKIMLGESQQEVLNTQRLIELAGAQYDLAEADYKRTEGLRQNFASQSELGAAKQSMLSALNQRVSLENQLDTLRTRLLRLESAIKLAETELRQARLNLERTEIRSPVDGVVVSEQVEKDSFVQRGASLMTIQDVSKAEIACSLRMDQLYWILDQTVVSRDTDINSTLATLQNLPPIEALVRFRLAGRSSVIYQWEGRLDRIEGTGLDLQSRMVPIRVIVDQPNVHRVVSSTRESLPSPIALVRGMFVDVILKAKPATQFILVPKLSVKPATDAYRIWKFEPNNEAYEVVRKRYALGDADLEESLSKENSVVRPVLVSERSPESVSKTQLASLDPAAWQAGFLTVQEGVQVIGTYFDAAGQQTEYWICDANRAGVLPGDYVVVTPIPGIETGREPIRVNRSSLVSASDLESDDSNRPLFGGDASQ